MKKNSNGRPTKYKKEYCQLVEAWMGKGMSLKSFGAEVGCSEDTVREWQDKHTDFSASIKKGQALLIKYYENFGRAIMNGSVKGANVTAWIFLTKNLIKWSDKIEHTGDIDKPLVMKYALDEDPDSLHTHQRTGTDDQSGKGNE
jgi:hypothetical protein